MDKSVTVCICMKRSEKSQFWSENSECIAHLSTTHSWSGPEVIKLFLCSSQLSMKFQMLISIKISRNSAFVRLR